MQKDKRRTYDSLGIIISIVIAEGVEMDLRLTKTGCV